MEQRTTTARVCPLTGLSKSRRPSPWPMSGEPASELSRDALATFHEVRAQQAHERNHNHLPPGHRSFHCHFVPRGYPQMTTADAVADAFIMEHNGNQSWLVNHFSTVQ